MKKLMVVGCFIFCFLVLASILLADPSYTIDEEEVITDSLLVNVTAETGDANFTHLNISTTAPYDSLVGYWSADGDVNDTKLTTAYDFSKYNNDGTMAGDAISTAGGKYGKGFEFDGDDFINCGDHPQVDSSPEVITLSAWIKRSSLQSGLKLFFMKYDASANKREFYFGINTDNLYWVVQELADVYDASTILTGDTAIQDYDWHHVVAIFEGGTKMQIYLDGESDGIDTTGIPNDFTDTDFPLLIGAQNLVGAGGFNGTIDDVMIFNTSLTAEQITDIYNNQSARFVGTGKQELNNQSYLNISSGNNRVNVTTIFDNNLDSNLSLFLQYYESGSWSSTSAQNLTSGANSTFTIGSSSTNLTLNYSLIAGTAAFYTPIVYGDIILDVYTVDTTYPEVEFVYPINTTYNSNINEINYTYTETSCESVWWTNISRVTNSSRVACGTNFTSVDYIEGSNTWILYINDSANNVNSSSMTFTIDTTYPLIDIAFPSDYANTSDTNVNINYTVSDTNLDNCWYSNDTYSLNVTLASCVNITTITWSEGQHNVTIWANDSAGNENSSSITFTIDTIPPYIAIAYPLNNSNVSGTGLNVNYTVSDATLSECWYSNDTYTLNTTLANCMNITNVVWSDGQHNVTIWANDSSNNVNSTFVTFNVETGASVTFCRELNTANTTYTLQNDIPTTGSCFTINANNITIDFNGYNVNGDCGFWDDGVINECYNDTTIKNGRLNSFYHNIRLGITYRANVTNMTLNGSCYCAIHTAGTRDSLIEKTNGLGSIMGGNVGGIILAGDNDTVDSCNMSYYDYSGINVAGGSALNYTIINNVFSFNMAEGIYVMSRNNNITNNTIYSNQECGIRLDSNADDNILIDNWIWNCSGTDYACIEVLDADNNIFDGNIVNYSSGYGIWIDSGFTNSVGNIFRNTKITETTLTAVNITDPGGLNNTFLNMTYSNESVDAGSELIRKWYYRAYVNDTSGDNVSNANITAFNVTKNLEFNITTDNTGYTPVHSITEYINNGTISYFSNYNIYAKNVSYDSVNHSYNVTSNFNNFKDVFTLTYAPSSQITIISPTNKTYNTTIISFNVSSDGNLSLCKFTVNNWATNYTMTEFNSTYFNYTNASMSQGSFLAEFWCNDSSGNINDTENTAFSVDSIYPSIYISFPDGYEYGKRAEESSIVIGFHYNITETNPDTASYTFTYFNGSTTSNASADFSKDFLLNLSDYGTYYLNVTENDTINQVTSLVHRFDIVIITGSMGSHAIINKTEEMNKTAEAPYYSYTQRNWKLLTLMIIVGFLILLIILDMRTNKIKKIAREVEKELKGGKRK